MKRVLMAVVVLAATGCYVPPKPAPPVKLETRFDPSSVAWARERGENRIEGTALLRTRGGEARTCAALDVALVPWSKHAGERMARLYGSIRSGFNPLPPYGRHPRWVNDDPAFYEHVIRTKCDGEGRFSFEELPDGEWFVEAVVTWDVPYANFSGGPQGGSLMQFVKTEGGATRKVVLAQ